MPDDDWALGQNEIDVRNEARRFACRNPEQAWIKAQEERLEIQLELAILKVNRATILEQEILPNLDAHRKRREALARADHEIQLLEKLLDPPVS